MGMVLLIDYLKYNWKQQKHFLILVLHFFCQFFIVKTRVRKTHFWRFSRTGSKQPKTGPESPTQFKTGSETRQGNAQTGQTSRDQARLRWSVLGVLMNICTHELCDKSCAACKAAQSDERFLWIWCDESPLLCLAYCEEEPLAQLLALASQHIMLKQCPRRHFEISCCCHSSEVMQAERTMNLGLSSLDHWFA